jgi:hypothetical protein
MELNTERTIFPGNKGIGTANVAKVKKMKNAKKIAPPRILFPRGLNQFTCISKFCYMSNIHLELKRLLDEFLDIQENRHSLQRHRS